MLEQKYRNFVCSTKVHTIRLSLSPTFLKFMRIVCVVCICSGGASRSPLTRSILLLAFLSEYKIFVDMCLPSQWYFEIKKNSFAFTWTHFHFEIALWMLAAKSGPCFRLKSNTLYCKFSAVLLPENVWQLAAWGYTTCRSELLIKDYAMICTHFIVDFAICNDKIQR